MWTMSNIQMPNGEEGNFNSKEVVHFQDEWLKPDSASFFVKKAIDWDLYI